MALVKRDVKITEEFIECDHCGATIKVHRPLSDIFDLVKRDNWYIKSDLSASLCPVCLEIIVNTYLASTGKKVTRKVAA